MTESQKSQGSYLFDPESASEMVRLIEQDQTMTNAWGGPLVGLPTFPPGSQIVDLACGPGGWAINAAHAFPDIDVAGVDISSSMIDYANARAHSQGLTNVSFGVMDITQPLEFSDSSFNLVNARTLFAVLPQKAWKPFIAECARILKPGGILRLTEPVDVGVTNSVALEYLLAALPQTLWKFGYSFSVDGRSFALLPTLPALLRETSYQDVYTSAFAIEFSSDTPGWIHFYHNYQISLLQSKPLFLKAGVMTEEEFTHAYQQTFIDMSQPDFCGLSTFVSVIGTKTV